MEVFLRIWLCLLLCLIGVQPSWTQERSDTAVISFLEQAYGVKFSDNNHIVLLPSGEKKFEDLFKAVAAARKSIHLEYFNFRNDSISEELFTLLAQKAAEGVEVRALFDGFGNSSNNKPLKRFTYRSFGNVVWRFMSLTRYAFRGSTMPFCATIVRL